MISVAMRTAPGLNAREHWRARARRVKKEREAIAWALLAPRMEKSGRPPLPCTVRLTRVAPSNGLDDDNLAGALKGVRDQVAQWLGVDDKDRYRVRYVYAQRRGPWSVEIEFGEPAADAAFVPLMDEACNA